MDKDTGMGKGTYMYTQRCRYGYRLAIGVYQVYIRNRLDVHQEYMQTQTKKNNTGVPIQTIWID